MNPARPTPLPDTDVVVVGAGPIGLVTALLLADAGLSVVVTERNPTISDEPRAISITDESLRVMAQVGILEALEPEMLMDTGMRYFGRKGQLLAEVRAKVRRLGQPVKSQFDQPVLVDLLLQAARQRPGIQVLFATEAAGVVNVDDGVEVALAGPSGSRRLRGQWLIACDGGRSPVRTQLGIALDGSTQVEKWIVVDVVNVPGEPDRYSQFHCNGVRPCVVVPGVKGRCRYEFMLLPEDDEASVVAAASIVELVAPYRRIEAGDIRRAAVYTAQQRIASTYRLGRVLLAGDAAHLMPPFAGQGLNAGIRDAANIAWKVAARVRREASDELIDSYQAERRPHAADMVRLSLRIGKVVMSTHPLGTALRDSAVTLLGVAPAAKRWLVGMRFLKQPHFTAGCVVAPGSRVPRQAADLVGRSLAQPLVRRADGSAVALDVVLGAGWALLRSGADGALSVRRQALSLAESVVDTEGAFRAIAGSGVVLLVRPDRYVAGAATRATLPAMLAALAPMVPRLTQWFAQSGSAFEAPSALTEPI